MNSLPGLAAWMPKKVLPTKRTLVCYKLVPRGLPCKFPCTRWHATCNNDQQCNIHPGELQARVPGTGTSGTSSGQKRADARDESLLLSEGNVFMVLREACWRRRRFLSEDFAGNVAVPKILLSDHCMSHTTGHQFYQANAPYLFFILKEHKQQSTV